MHYDYSYLYGLFEKGVSIRPPCSVEKVHLESCLACYLKICAIKLLN